MASPTLASGCPSSIISAEPLVITAPHPSLSPTLAAALPLTKNRLEPLLMLVGPHNGQW
ncbi:hypothetical protein X970_16090 [Pseudomonas monteilii SB3101]|uniref:Uncharacterized protein n=1 Tax=Pseudomonas monteilii SB3101 TaxID=1435058 RepID=V9V8U6_9PSED|nr:hypothetical protein X969_16445 [Pseudomonas monteilii SB3078]AHC91137.1 hypothetical protein X970_16090 [Pseudomonas monteilii SB3101]